MQTSIRKRKDMSFLDGVFPQRVYREAFLPEGDFRDEWIIQPKTPNDEFYRNVMSDEPYWVLYDHSELELYKDEKEISKQDIPEKQQHMPRQFRLISSI